MQCVILAAGRGVRMGNLTNDTPKPMLKINGKPILEYILANLPNEISEIIIVLGYKGEIIKSYFKDLYQDKKIRYVVQNELNGSGGALHSAKEFLRDKFLVLNADDLYGKSDLEKFIANDPPAILAKEVENSGRFGVLKTDDNGCLLEIIEAPKKNYGNLINTGAYLLNNNFFDYELVKKSTQISEKELGLPQTMMKMNKDYKIKVAKAKFWRPIGYPEDISKAEKIMI